MSNKSFYIIDGHAHIYRAYFAPFRDLTSGTGEPTKATYVFTQMLMNLVQTRRPDYLAMVIDSGDEAVFRKAIYPDYKATRQSPPDDYKPQERRILQVVADAGVPIFEKPGFEADDLIATMARRLGREGFDVFLVSKDKDLRQLLTGNVRMYDPQSDESFGPEEMQAKLGYTPEQAVEVQTLMGDKIDNVPGIPGVGEKTAAKLVIKYGSADAVLHHLDDLTPKMRENFEKHADGLKLSRSLVTLKDDVEFDYTIDQCRFDGFVESGLAKHLEELNFNSLLERLGPIQRASSPSAKAARADKSAAAGAVPKKQPEGGLFGGGSDGPVTREEEADYATSKGIAYVCVTRPEQLDALTAELRAAELVAFDTETDNLSPCAADVVGISLCTGPGSGWYVPLRGPMGTELLPGKLVLDALGPILADTKVKKIGHNVKYDVITLKNIGLDVAGILGDTMLAAFLLDAGRMQFGIDRLALDLLNFKKIPTTDLIGKGKSQITMDRVDLPTITRYACEDVDVTLRLWRVLLPELEKRETLKKLSDEIETPLIDVLVEMERNGIAVDPKILAEQSEVLGGRINALREEIIKLAGVEFSIDSPKQLSDVLFTRLQLKPVKKIKTGYSTDVEVLEKLSVEHPVPRLVLEYRQLQKLKNTYLDNLQNDRSERDGRIHTSFNQTGAATGRLSSSDPNLQNIPIRTDEGRRIRLAFVAGGPGRVLMSADYSQIELRVLAHLSKEPALIEAFRNDEDIHAAVASEVFGVKLADVTREQRGNAKTINFGIVYGVTAFGLQRRIDGLSYQGAADLIASYNRRFPKIAEFLEQCVQVAQQNGYVETMMGRRRPVPEVESRIASMRAAAERIAINSVVQGSAADLIKIAMVNIHRRLREEGRPSRMLLQVHDELVFETPEDAVEAEAAMVRQEMVSAMSLDVPLKVDVGWGKNWGEVK